MHTSSTPRFLISVSTCSQYLAPSPPVPTQSPRMSRLPSTVTPIAAVDGPVGDLTVADLHHDRVDEHHRIDAIERPVQPVGHLLEDPVGDLRDRLPGDLGPVDLGEMRFDLTGREPLRGQRDAPSSRPRRGGVGACGRSWVRSCRHDRVARRSSTGPTSVITVLDRVPLRELPPLRPSAACLS